MNARIVRISGSWFEYSPCQTWPGMVSWWTSVGNVELAVQVGGAQIDPESCRGSCRRSSPRRHKRSGAPGSSDRRQAPHFEIGAHHRVERARHLRADPGDALLDERHDLGAARIALGELEARVLAQRGHALADRALGVAEAAQDRVHPRLDLGELGQAHLVDFVGRHARGGAGARAPRRTTRRRAAAPTCPGRRRPGVAWRLSSASWRSSAAAIGPVTMAERARAPVAGDVRLAGARGRAIRPCPPPAFASAIEDSICGIALASRKSGGTTPMPRGRADPLELAVEQRGSCCEPLQVILGIGRVAHRVVGIEEARDNRGRRRRSGSRRKACCASRRPRHRRRAGRSRRARSHKRFRPLRSWCGWRDRARRCRWRGRGQGRRAKCRQAWRSPRARRRRGGRASRRGRRRRGRARSRPSGASSSRFQAMSSSSACGLGWCGGDRAVAQPGKASERDARAEPGEGLAPGEGLS